MRFRFDLKIIILIFLFLLTRQIEIYVTIMFFSLLHELGHVILGILVGMKPVKIEVMPFGFSASFKLIYNDFSTKISNENLKEIKKIIVYISGPATNVLIIFILIFLKIDYIYLDLAVYSNLLIILINILPIYPLDGGRILKSFLHIFYNETFAKNVTNKVANITMIVITFAGSIGVFYFKNIAIFLVIVFLWYLIIGENNKECMND